MIYLKQKQAELGLANLDKEEREANAFETVLQILSLSSDHRTVLICFDELETLNPNEASFPRPRSVAELVKNLFDSLNLASTSQGCRHLNSNDAGHMER
jgi:hypothetical protein